MAITIRKAIETDEAALSKICLLTADAGRSAEHLHDFGELPGLVYAVPYVKLPTTWGFVMVDSNKGDEVVGYILGSKDTRAFEDFAAKNWWPNLAAQYPSDQATKPADIRYCRMLQDVPIASDAVIQFAAAHLHIDILPEYQKQGWGTRLITESIEYLRHESIEGEGIWLGMDPKNEGAKLFYAKLGFQPIPGAPEWYAGIRFKDYVY